MRGDATIHGRLVVPATQREAWLAAELDWKSVEGNGALKGYISGETVAEIVEGVNFDEPSEFLRLIWTGDELELRSFQSQAGFSESMVGFAAAWAAAAGFGGHGVLIGAGISWRIAYRIEVADGAARVARVPDDQYDPLAQDPDAVALRQQIMSTGGPMAAKLTAALSKPALAAPVPRVIADAPAKPAKPAKKPAAKKPSAKS